LKKEKENINKRISDESINKRNYHSLCFALLRIILSRDKYKITYIDPAEFEDNTFGLMLIEMNCIRPVEVPEGIAFVANNDGKKLLFCFDDQEPGLLRQIANIIKDSDKGEFNTICVMIVRDMASMKDRRSVLQVDDWPRGFFLCFEEIQRKAENLNAEEYAQLCSRAGLSESPERTPIMSVTAEVKENIPVGENRSHFKLRFKTSRSFNIIPGQFIMVATSPQKKDTISEFIKWDTMNPSWIEPKAYLKRPFGIHRAFYKYFSEDKNYLRKLSLPPQLSTLLHTVFPNQFEIFYKVLPNGLGTRELSKLQKGHKIQILGPLGKREKIREIRDEGFDEIHVIGGGVGMAPLIFIVQALRYYSYNVKAFIGIEKMEMLKYKLNSDGLDATFSEEDPTIYVDDLIETGMDRSDIYVSSEEEIVYRRIPKENLYKGFVSGQYDNYLLHSRSARKILAFACGPFDMMKALVPITEKYGILLKVLIEKRMACGIGVCLSCVCETRKSVEAESRYSRVCTDGPIFDANEIVWK
jgi:dihydroorotate dehydrogenase electron transfer subunit